MHAENREYPQSSMDGSVFETLARETGSEPAHVEELYEREFAHLQATSKVKGFLSLLACRNVRMELRKSDTHSG